MTELWNVFSITLALRSAGLDRWTCSYPQECPHLYWVESMNRQGWVRIGPLGGGRAALPADRAVEIIRAFADRRGECNDEYATADEAEELWARLHDAAEAIVLGVAA